MAKLLSRKFKKKVLEAVAPYLLYIIISLIYLTCKKKFHFNKEKVVDTSSIFAVWHGELVMIPFAFNTFRKRKSVDPIVSDHTDGEIATRLIKLLGYGVIRGSSTRGGIKALKAAFKSIAKGRDVAITPDGPKGPRHSVSDGIVHIAQKKNIPIVTMNCNASKCWRFSSWDKSFIPKPFSTLDFYFGDPFYIKDESLESAKELIKERLMKNAF